MTSAIDRDSFDHIVLPGYKLISLLGSGGMANVYLALHERLNRQVAIKVMTQSLTEDAQFRSRFLAEARIVARLDHPGVVTVFDIDEANGALYMAMEYAGGGTLKERINGPMQPVEALRVLRGVSEALGFAHATGFVHRDVKSANILFKLNEQPLISDFGIAKAIDTSSEYTRMGISVGTPHYMSPEQVAGKQTDARADIYGLGIVLYEMLTGARPYSEGDSMAIAMAHVTEPVPALAGPLVRYQPLLSRMLAKLPEDRYTSADELAADIDKLAEDATRFDRAPLQPDAVTMTAPAMAGVRNDAETVLAPRAATAAAPATAASPAASHTATALAPAQAGPGQVSAAVVGHAPNAARVPVMRVAMLLLAVALLAGAAWFGTQQHKPAAPQVVVQPRTQTSPILSAEQRQTVTNLLEAAEVHEMVGRVFEPPHGNAYDSYAKVLEIDPGHPTALAARARLERIRP